MPTDQMISEFGRAILVFPAKLEEPHCCRAHISLVKFRSFPPHPFV
jgi:hypothetical protein